MKSIITFFKKLIIQLFDESAKAAIKKAKQIIADDIVTIKETLAGNETHVEAAIKMKKEQLLAKINTIIQKKII